eukprot:m.106392 g.106392  ORF g.106392 m.106392 type:complete len:733 (-) comp9151_c0_seq14:99-2297(-)
METRDVGQLIPPTLGSIVSSALGVASIPLVREALNAPQALYRTRVTFKCNREINILPRLEDVKKPTTFGILQDIVIKIEHRCACPNEPNCTLSFPPSPRSGGCQSFNRNAELIITIALTIFFALVEKRLSVKPAWFWGLFSFPLPYNFLENRSRRLIPVLGLALFSINLFSNFFEIAFSNSSSEWYSTFVVFGSAIIYSFSVFPVFLASSCRIQWLGGIIGSIFSLVTFVFTIKAAKCLNDTGVPLLVLPILSAMLLAAIFVLYAYNTYWDIMKRVNGELTWTEPSRKNGTRKDLAALKFYEGHVRNLLFTARMARSKLSLVKSVTNKILNTEHFRYNARILAAGFISALWIIMFTTLFISPLAFSIEILLGELLNSGSNLYCRALPGYIYFPPSEVVLSVFLDLRLGCKTNETIAVVFFWVITGATLISAITQSIFLVSLFRDHNRRIRELIRGNYTSLPRNRPSPASAVSNMVKYVGYQIAHTYAGFIVLFLVYFLICVAIALLIVLPMLDILPFYLLGFIERQLPSLAVSILFSYSQLYIVKWFFLVNKSSVGIRNRALFHIVDLIFFVFNAIYGALLFIKRWLYAMVFSVLFVSRMDVTSLPAGVEHWDASYSAYVGFLLVDAYYSNPSLITFCRILLDTLPSYSGEILHKCGGVKQVQAMKKMDHCLSGIVNEGSSLSAEDRSSPKDDLKRRKVARNRWFLAVTLMRNPSLIHHRRSNKTGQTVWYV